MTGIHHDDSDRTENREPTYADLTEVEKRAHHRAMARERLERQGLIPRVTRGPEDINPTRYGPADLLTSTEVNQGNADESDEAAVSGPSGGIDNDEFGDD